ncbi:MAG: MFS transporter [Myxococcota bacterium]
MSLIHGDPPLRKLFGSVYYGWIVAVGASLNSFVVVGIGFYAMAVFLDALSAERGWSRTEVSFATTLYFVTSGLVGPWVGRAVDRFGPRVAIGVGAAIMALGLVWLGRIERPGQLAQIYPVLAIGFALASAIPSSAIVTRWFERRRAQAMSIAQTGVSVGGVVLVPLITASLLERGLAHTTAFLAGLLCLVVWPVTALLLRNDPRAVGQSPDGQSPAESRPAFAAGELWTQRAAARTTTFWRLVFAFSGILFCQVGAAMHQLSVVREHLPAEVASLALSTTAAASIIGRLIVGSFADRVDQRVLTVGLVALQAAAIATLGFAETAPALFLASAAFGFTIGNVFMLQSLLVAQLFGVRSFGTVLGLVQLLTQTASGLGPLALGAMYAWLGYGPGLGALAGIAALGSVALVGARPAVAPEPDQAGTLAPRKSGA